MGMVYELDDIEKRAVLPPTESSAMEFVSAIARMTKDGECAACGSAQKKNPECNEHHVWEANAIDSFNTLQSLITKARQLAAAHDTTTPGIQ